MTSRNVGPGLEEKVKDAIAGELERQAENRPGTLTVRRRNGKLLVEGEIDLDDLAMVVICSLAGGP